MKKSTEPKQFFENRNVLFSIAAVCAAGIILITVLFSLAVFDSVNMMSSVNVKSKNIVSYTVKLTPDAYEPPNNFFPKDTLGAGETYLLRFTDKITVNAGVEAIFSKSVLELDYDYTMVKKFIIRSQGNGNPIVLSRSESTVDLLRENSPFQKIETHKPDYLEIILTDPFEISLDNYIKEFQEFEKEVRKESPSIRLSGELVVEFTLKMNDGNNIISTMTRGVVIPITSEVYKISFTGTDALDQNFPERDIKLPALPITILVVLVMIALIWGLNASLKKVFYEKDEYKRTIKSIFKKSVDAIIMTDPKATIPDYPSIDVKDFKELAKTSQSLNKPIVCFEKNESTVFYIVCDNLLYKFKLTNKSD